MSVPSALLVLAGIQVAALFAVRAIHAEPLASRPSLAPPSGGLPTLSALRLFTEAPFLRNLALLVGTGAALSSLLDYVLGVQAVAALGRGQSLLAFFSMFGVVVSVLSFALQVAFGRVAMEKLNLAVHLAVLPGVVVMGGAFGLAVPGLVSTAILRGAEMVHRNTLFRSAYEVLYTPIPELQKRATKALIDVGFDRAGTIAGSLLTMGAVWLVAPTQQVLLGVVVLGALCTLPLVRALHRNYVSALEESLRAAAPHEPVPGAPLDEPARDKLLGAVARLAPRPDDHGVAHATLADPRPLLAASSELLGRSEARALRALERLPRAAAGYALLLLAHPTRSRAARAALVALGPSIVGQLVDAMLDPTMDFVVRRRVPRILAASPTQRAAEGLLEALADARFEVRYAAGRALMRMLERTPELTLPRDAIARAILAEIAREQEYAAALGDDELDGDALEPLDVVTRDRVSRGLEHLFNELAILLGSEAVRICFRALHQDDDRARGTALEYLQTVLPVDVRDAIWPLLGEERPLPSVRAASEVLADLTRAMDQKMATPPPSQTRGIGTTVPMPVSTAVGSGRRP